tara:strand:- start:271 stop:456 length:186 start_codon:yes stop_codon:yes gene_type:complete
MNNEQKAALYDQYLREHDAKAREVSVLRSKFDLTRDDESKIKELKMEMDGIQKKASDLGSI